MIGGGLAFAQLLFLDMSIEQHLAGCSERLYNSWSSNRIYKVANIINDSSEPSTDSAPGVYTW